MKRSHRLRPTGLAALAAGATLAITACSGQSLQVPSASSSPDQISVVTTTTQLADIAQQVAGDQATVTSLIQPNQSAHSFDPTPAQLQQIAAAALLIENGAGLETWLDDTVESSGYTGQVVDSSEGITLRAGDDEEEADHDHEDETDHDEEGDEHDHEHGEYDPHIWTAPANLIVMTQNVIDGMAAADPDHAADYRANGDAYIAKLKDLQQWMTDSFDQVPEAQRTYVSSHDAFGYLDDEFHLTLVGAVIPSLEDNAEPSAEDLADLREAIESTGVKAIFSEASISPKAAEAIGKETGVTVYSGDDGLYGDSLGEPGTEAATNIGAAIHNTTVLLKAWAKTPVALPDSLE